MKKETEILAALMPYVSAFPNAKQLPEETLAIYGRALSTLSPAEVSAAMMLLVRTAKFFPTIAEILEAAKTMKEHINGDTVPSASEAWEMAMSCSKKIGYYGKWDLPEPVAQVVKAFGKTELCMLEMNAVNTARAQFMRMYQEKIDRAKKTSESEDAIKALGSKAILLLEKIKQIGGNEHEQMGTYASV